MGLTLRAALPVRQRCFRVGCQLLRYEPTTELRYDKKQGDHHQLPKYFQVIRSRMMGSLGFPVENVLRIRNAILLHYPIIGTDIREGSLTLRQD